MSVAVALTNKMEGMAETITLMLLILVHMPTPLVASSTWHKTLCPSSYFIWQKLYSCCFTDFHSGLLKYSHSSPHNIYFLFSLPFQQNPDQDRYQDYGLLRHGTMQFCTPPIATWCHRLVDQIFYIQGCAQPQTSHHG